MADTPTQSKADGFAALKEPHVGVFTAGRAFSNLAFQVVSVAVGWDLYERTGDPLSLGLVGAAQVLPAVLLMLLAGSVTDRFSRRNVAMIAASILLGRTLAPLEQQWGGSLAERNARQLAIFKAASAAATSA